MSLASGSQPSTLQSLGPASRGSLVLQDLKSGSLLDRAGLPSGTSVSCLGLLPFAWLDSKGSHSLDYEVTCQTQLCLAEDFS